MENSSQFIYWLSWSAVFLLSISYWFQIWKTHVHKEVRDLSMTYHVLLALGFGILTYTALIEGSKIFLAKQILTTIPVLVIIAQIVVHRNQRWHDDEDKNCVSCGNELEMDWKFCAFCGESRDSKSDETVVNQELNFNKTEFQKLEKQTIA